MPSTASAGTLVSAAMQTAGLASQEAILRDFATFFESGGALIYIIAGIGAVLSVVSFGSYRMARYLLLGPALFWFLVNVTTSQPGVQWRLGDGNPRSLAGASDAEGSLQSIRLIEANSRTVGTRSVAGEYTVSWTFAWFTTLIDEFVRQTVGLILSFENDEDLMFISRTETFRQLRDAVPEDSRLLEMINGRFSSECRDMMGAAITLANPDLDIEHFRAAVAAARDGGADTAEVNNLQRLVDEVEQKRAQYEEAYNNGAARLLNPDLVTQEYIAANPSRVSSRLAAAGGNVENLAISCADNWNIITDVILDEASYFVDQLIQQNALEDSDAGRVRQSREQLCEAIAQKLVEDGVTEVHRAAYASRIEGYECPLVPIAGMFMLRNTIMGSGSRQAAIQSHWNRAQLLASSKPGDRIIPVVNNPEDYVAVSRDPARAARQEAGAYRSDPTQTYDLNVSYDPASGESVAEFLNTETGQREWHQFGVVGKISGHADNAWTEHQTYLSRGLRQQIFQTALQMPYYQGMILYFLSVAFPFLALVVITPSHASSVFYLPLAWLWVKSWDIGFAMVIVLEKVLWNILPNSDLEESFAVAEGLDGYFLPDLLKESLAIDPSFHVHAYYLIIGMVMFAIPAITGHVILKSKSQVLASFTQPMANVAREARDSAESAYGLRRITGKQQSIVTRQGAALLANSRMTTAAASARNAQAGGPSAGLSGPGAILSNAARESLGDADTQRTAIGTNALQAAARVAGGSTGVEDTIASTAISRLQGTASQLNSLETARRNMEGEIAGTMSDENGMFGALSIQVRAALSSFEAQADEDPDGDKPPSGFVTGFDVGDNYRVGASGRVSSYWSQHYTSWFKASVAAARAAGRRLPDLDNQPIEEIAVVVGHVMARELAQNARAIGVNIDEDSVFDFNQIFARSAAENVEGFVQSVERFENEVILSQTPHVEDYLSHRIVPVVPGEGDDEDSVEGGGE